MILDIRESGINPKNYPCSFFWLLANSAIMTAIAEPKTERIIEALTDSARVDTENGVIKNVKLIGFESRNGRVYPPTVLKAAVHLYEGAKVNIDHPDGAPTKARKYGDRLGVIRSARFVEGSGIFGDFHFNPNHPLAKQVIWDAQHNPEALGFSHNALLRLGQKQNGKQTIEEILNIRSMDLVADPATTSSLFESEEMGPEAPVADTVDPKASMKAAFRQMIMAAVDDEALDMKATMAKIKEIMKAQEKLMGGGSSSPSKSDDDESSPEEESVQLKQQIGLLKQQLEHYQAKEKQRELQDAIEQELVAAGLDPADKAQVSPLFSKQLLATESKDDRDDLIKDRVSLIGKNQTNSTAGKPVYKPQASSAVEELDCKRWVS